MESVERELKAGREKYWKELTDAEKIERTRHALKRLKSAVEDIEASWRK